MTTFVTVKERVKCNVVEKISHSANQRLQRPFVKNKESFYLR